MSPKTKVSVKVIRDGREKNFTVTLGTLPDEPGGPGEDSAAPESKVEQLEGVEVSDLSAESRQKYEIPTRIKGALVSNVDPDSKAAKEGLREGDVIVEINRQPVTNAEQAVDLSEKAKGDRVLLKVYRMENGLGATRYMTVEATKKG
jgi:serine protease Do